MKPAPTRFVSYIRVSTSEQGRSGLGLEAQRADVASYVRGRGSIDREFKEIETATGKRKRPVLAEALVFCRITDSVLIVAKVDRLIRSVDFLSKLRESGVEISFADLPHIDGPQGRFLLHQMAAVAELEAGLISERTKKALQAAKARGVKLGNPNGAEPFRRAAKAHNTALAAIKTKSDQFVAQISSILQELRHHRSLRQIATEFNQRGLKTPRGNGIWTACTVSRALAHLDRSPHRYVPPKHIPGKNDISKR